MSDWGTRLNELMPDREDKRPDMSDDASPMELRHRIRDLERKLAAVLALCDPVEISAKAEAEAEVRRLEALICEFDEGARCEWCRRVYLYEDMEVLYGDPDDQESPMWYCRPCIEKGDCLIKDEKKFGHGQVRAVAEGEGTK